MLTVLRKLASALLASALILPTTQAFAAPEAPGDQPIGVENSVPAPVSATPDAAPVETDAAPVETDAGEAAPAPAETTSAPESKAAPTNVLGSERAFAETMRVNLRLGELDGSAFADTGQQFWSEETINAAADIDVSGEGVTIPKAKVVITVPRTANLVVKPNFAASNGATAQSLQETDEAWVQTFEYETLSGGFHATYPFPFKFSKDTVTGKPDFDRITVNVKLVGEDGATLYSADKTYVAKTAKLVPWSYEWDYVKNYDPDTQTGHVEAWVQDNTATRTNPAKPAVGCAFINTYLDVPEGIPGGYGLIQPKNIKLTIDLPEGVRLGEPTYDQTGKLTGFSDTSAWTSSEDGRSVSITHETPSFTWAHPQVTNGKGSYWFQPCFSFVDVPLNTPTRLTIHHTVNAGLEGEYALQDRTADFIPDPQYFTPGGDLEFFKTGRVGEALNLYSPSDAFAWEQRDYAVMGEKYFHRHLDLTEDGPMMVTKACNTNKGASLTDPTNGRVHKIFDLTHNLLFAQGEEGNRRYTGFELLGFAFKNATSASNERLKGFVTQFNGLSKVLWGYTAAGDKIELARDFNAGQRIAIDAAKGDIVKLVLEFTGEPLILDNACLIAGDFMKLNASELEKFVASENAGIYSKRYYEDAQLTYSFGYRSDPVKKQTEKSGGLGNATSSTDIMTLQPKVKTYVGQDKTVAYKDGGTPFQLYVGSEGWETRGAAGNSWGDMKEIQDLKTITLLPAGIEFDEVDKWQTKWEDLGLSGPMELVENFQNTGMKAVILRYSKPDPYGNYQKFLPLRATKDTKAGANKVHTYMTYGNNQLVTPLLTEQRYVDALDLDQDGNTSEVFAHSASTVNFIPSYELILHDSIRLPGQQEAASAVTGDLGGGAEKVISIFNNSIIDVKSLSIIDVLPAPGDHAIVPNDAGKYESRGSTFATPLSASLESVHANADLFGEQGRFEVLYQLESQGADLESVRDGAWHRAEEIQDFSKVKSFKIVLKPGSILKVAETVDFVLPASIPYTPEMKDMDQGSAVAFNTSAFSTDAKTYTEANRTETRFVTYKVTGHVYHDKNENKIFDEDDELLPGAKVTLVKASDASTATRPDGEAITATTDNKGEFTLPVYTRGDYELRFTRPNTNLRYLVEAPDAPTTRDPGTQDSPNTAIGIVSGVNAAMDSAGTVCEPDAVARTDSFSLNPAHPKDVGNQALYSHLGSVTILKTDKQTGKPVQGAEFTATAPTGKDADGCEIDPITRVSGVDGRVVFDAMPYGSYSVAETKAPTSYADPSWSRDVTIDSSTRADLGTVVNTLKLGTVTVVKTDPAGTALKDAVFSLKGKATNGIEVDETATTGEDGRAIFEKVPYGSYTLTETKAPLGYVPAEAKSITLEGDGELNVPVVDEVDLSTVTVKKVDAADSDKGLPGAVFTISGTDVTGKAFADEATSAANGVATFTRVPSGTYTISEKTPPKGYQLASKAIENIKVTGQNDVVDAGVVKNEKITGSVTLRKIDDTGARLQGVVFALVKDGAEVDSKATDAEGTLTFSGVGYGDYVVVEKKTLESHRLLDKAVATVAIREQGKVYDLGEILNRIKRGTVELLKKDARTGQPIAGALFALVDGSDKEIARFTTGADGKATFADVAYGEYRVRELEAAKGYLLPENPDVKVVVNEDLATMTASMVNERAQGTITVTKKDAKSEAPLEGTEFTLTGTDFLGEKVTRTAKSDAQGIARFEGLDFGDYEIVESAAPRGYLLNEEPIRGLVIDTADQALDAGVVIDRRISGTVRLVKTDASNGNALAGAEFTLSGTNIAGEEIERTSVSDTQGIVLFEGVDYGTYTVRETAAPTGYALNDTETRKVEVVNDGEEYELEGIANERLLAKIRVMKTDSVSGDALGGAEFSLEGTDLAGESVKRVVTTGTDGSALFDEIPFGTYTLKETKAPKGYVEPTWSQEVKVDDTVLESGIDLTVKNVKLPPVPQALGRTGADTVGIGIGVLVLLGLGGLGIYLKRRQR